MRALHMNLQMNGLLHACSQRVQPNLVKTGLMKTLLASLLALAAIAATGSAPGAAARADDLPGAYEASVQADVVPMRVAIDAALRAHPGSQYVTGRFESGAQPLYIIRIVTREGQRRDVRVDARTGRVIG
jgi:uncharacterized membrane protein YkoI